jgi:hypothetical protein
MKKIYLFILVFIVSVVQMSCEKDFLNVPAKGAFDKSILSNKAGIDGLLIGCYALLNDGNAADPTLNTIQQRGGQQYKGSNAGDQPAMMEAAQMQWSTGNSYVSGPWRNAYTGIDRCNTVIRLCATATGMTDAQKLQVVAEARFLRSYWYFWLKKLYLHVPWLDETVLPANPSTADYQVPNTVNNDGVTWVNCWPQLLADMDFARQNLPATQTQAGRPNKWAADIFYAKELIYAAGYFGEGLAPYANDYATPLAILQNAIANGRTYDNKPYILVANYHDNFDGATRNNAESIWAVQMSVNDYASGAEGNANSSSRYGGVYLNSKSVPGTGSGWGFFQPTPWSADHFRVDGKGLPFLDYLDTQTRRLKTDLGLADSDPFTPDTSSVDPRLDWTVTRRGVPCLDYGNMPGKSWVRDQQHGGPYEAKKWFVWKSQVGVYTGSPNGYSASINIPIIRYADVLLLTAECMARTNTGDLGLAYVNQIRNRMKTNTTSPTNWVKKYTTVTPLVWSTTNAATYKIGLYPASAFSTQAKALDRILFERNLELAYEQPVFFDLVRFGKDEEVLNKFIAAEKGNFDYLKFSVYTAVPDRYMPIPQTAVDNSLKGGVLTLTQNPGY